MQRVSSGGLRFIASFEGWRARAYQDAVGVWTIGFGHTHGVRRGQAISKARGFQLLRADAATAERAVRKLVKVHLNQNQFDALVSFVFNVGVGAFAGSTALKKLNRRDYKGAADALLAWDKGRIDGRLVALPGLTRRRKAEHGLFRRGTR